MASPWREKIAHIEKYPHRGNPPHMELFYSFSHAPPPQARQTQPNSGGVAEGQPRFDKGGLQYFFTFYALKIELLEFLRYAIKKGPLLRILVFTL